MKRLLTFALLGPLIGWLSFMMIDGYDRVWRPDLTNRLCFLLLFYVFGTLPAIFASWADASVPYLPLRHYVSTASAVASVLITLGLIRFVSFFGDRHGYVLLVSAGVASLTCSFLAAKTEKQEARRATAAALASE